MAPFVYPKFVDAILRGPCNTNYVHLEIESTLSQGDKAVVGVFEALELESGIAEQMGHAGVVGEYVSADDAAHGFVVGVNGFAALAV